MKLILLSFVAITSIIHFSKSGNSSYDHKELIANGIEIKAVTCQAYNFSQGADTDEPCTRRQSPIPYTYGKFEFWDSAFTYSSSENENVESYNNTNNLIREDNFVKNKDFDCKQAFPDAENLMQDNSMANVWTRHQFVNCK